MSRVKNQIYIGSRGSTSYDGDVMECVDRETLEFRMLVDWTEDKLSYIPYGDTYHTYDFITLFLDGKWIATLEKRFLSHDGDLFWAYEDDPETSEKYLVMEFDYITLDCTMIHLKDIRVTDEDYDHLCTQEE